MQAAPSSIQALRGIIAGLERLKAETDRAGYWVTSEKLNAALEEAYRELRALDGTHRH